MPIRGSCISQNYILISMELTVKKNVDTTGWVLKVFLGNIAEWWDEKPFVFDNEEYTNIDDFERDYPYLVDIQPPYYRTDPEWGTKTIKLCIDLRTGKVLNWPEGIDFDFNDYKLVDTGRYEIHQPSGELQAGYTGYVPGCFSIDERGYGDYLQFHIHDSQIVGWNFDQDDYDGFMEECNE